jgi:cyclase
MVPSWKTGTVELAPNIFAYVQGGGGLCIANAGIIGAPGETTVIDALFTPTMTRALLDEARRVAAAPIRRLINTHHHVDHTLGNALFPAETEVLAHARAKSEMQRVGLGVLSLITRIAPHFAPDLEGARERLPDVTFDGDALQFESAGRPVRLLHYGTAHTRGDVLVHLPEERILFAGDVGFFSVTPLAFEGHIGNWIAIGRRVIGEVDAATIVPGHGPPGTKDDLRHMLDYLELVRDGARRAFDSGATPEEATRDIDIGPYAEWAEPERLAPNVARLYQEFRGEITP